MSVSQSMEYLGKPVTAPRTEKGTRTETETRRVTVRLSGLRGATHAILRIGAGLLFFLHGAPKLLGWFGGVGPNGESAELFSLFGLAGVLEVFGGLAIALGFLTRPVAVLLAIEMLVAYFYAHAPQGPIPYANGGELALLYGLVWVYLAANGAGPASVDWRRGPRKTVAR